MPPAKGGSQDPKAFTGNLQGEPRPDGRLHQPADIVGRRSVAFDDALAPAMSIRIGQQRRADIVGPIDNQDAFALRQAPGDCVIILREVRGVTFACIGQQAKEMVWAKPNGHSDLGLFRRERA